MILTFSTEAEVVLKAESVVETVQLLGVQVVASSVDVILCDVDDADVQVEVSHVGEEAVELFVVSVVELVVV